MLSGKHKCVNEAPGRAALSADDIEIMHIISSKPCILYGEKAVDDVNSGRGLFFSALQ